MKVFSKINIKKTQTNSFQKPVLTYFLLSVLLVSLFILFTACDNRTTSSTTRPVTTNQPTRNFVATSSTATPNPTTRPGGQVTSIAAGSAAAPLADESLSNQPADRPTISFSPEIVRIGESVEISGSGYPANTRLNVQLATADFKTVETYATILTDETGSFKTSLKLEGWTQSSFLTPGKLEIAVTTIDRQIGASAPLALQPATNSSPDEACMNLVREFFSTLKRDTQSAQVYLTTNLRGKISSGKTSLPGLLGLQNTPVRVEIAKVKDSNNSYQATMFFSNGEQKLVELDVTTDISGALKISTIRAK